MTRVAPGQTRNTVESSRPSVPLDELKVLIVLQAGTELHEGRARALHAMLYAKELTEAGASVRVVFDGAGTEWLARFRTPAGQGSRSGQLFRELTEAGLTYEVCDYCAGAFDVREELVAAGEALTGRYFDHPSLIGHLRDGFQVWIL